MGRNEFFDKEARRKKIQEAINEKNSDTLRVLANNPDSRVRRAVAKNINTDGKTIEKLAFDPVMNVNYFARISYKYTGERKLKKATDEKMPKCVVCEVPEDVFECHSCTKPKLMTHC